MAATGSIRGTNGFPPTGVGFPDSNGAFWNTSYQTPFFNVYMYANAPNSPYGSAPGVLLGGIQSFRPTENAPTQDGYMSGSDWIEFFMQPRVWTVSCMRWIPRDFDIRVNMRRIYPNCQDVDPRVLPVFLYMKYLQQDPSGSTQVESSSWTLCQGTFQQIDGPYWDGPFSPVSESWTFKGRGIQYQDSGSGAGWYQNNSALWGQGPATGSTSSSSSSTSSGGSGGGGGVGIGVP